MIEFLGIVVLLRKSDDLFATKNQVAGNVYAPVTNKFTLLEEEWQLEMKSNKFVESLRNAPLLFPELCMSLFDGSTCSGFDGWEPSSGLPHPSDDNPDPDLNEYDDIHHISTQPMTSTQPPASTEPAASTEESSFRSQARSKKRKRKETINSKIIEIGEEISKIAKMFVEKYITDDMDACMDKLEKIGWGIHNPKYDTAVLLFGESPDLRKVWLRLKPEGCENWIRNAGSKYGLL